MTLILSIKRKEGTKSFMNGTDLIKLALDLGFADAAVINTQELVFVPN